MRNSHDFAPVVACVRSPFGRKRALVNGARERASYDLFVASRSKRARRKSPVKTCKSLLASLGNGNARSMLDDAGRIGGGSPRWQSREHQRSVRLALCLSRRGGGQRALAVRLAGSIWWGFGWREAIASSNRSRLLSSCARLPLNGPGVGCEAKFGRMGASVMDSV